MRFARKCGDCRAGSAAGALAAALILLLASTTAAAHSVKQKAGSYIDNQGRERQRLQMDLVYDGKGSGSVSSSSLTVSAGRDNYVFSEETDSDYNQLVYGDRTHTQNNVTVSGNLTWDRLTDTRALVSMQSDGKVTARTGSVGASQWLYHETLRVSYDLSRTIVEQPEYKFLDYDSQEVGNPTLVTSVGATVGVRHLASTTTIRDYSVSRIENENRPATNTGTVGVREFFPSVNGALHANVTRAYNRGYIGTDTTYGQVDAWSFETAWLRDFGRGASGRLAYRYYQEDETTRAYEDEKVFGSDMFSLSVVQEITKKMVDSVTVPLQIEAGAAKYLTNVGVAANSYEMGVSARF
jgi:hypothetical protein